MRKYIVTKTYEVNISDADLEDVYQGPWMFEEGEYSTAETATETLHEVLNFMVEGYHVGNYTEFVTETNTSISPK